MNDKTIIRPGGRKPKKDTDDKTMVRRGPAADDQDENEPEDDRTMVRPRGSQASNPDPDPGPGDQEPAEEKTQFRPVTRPRPGGNRPRPGGSRQRGGKSDDLSAIDQAFGFDEDGDDSSAPEDQGDDRTMVRPRGSQRAEADNTPEPDSSDEEKTQFRPITRRGRGEQTVQGSNSGDEEKTQFRPLGRRGRQAQGAPTSQQPPKTSGVTSGETAASITNQFVMHQDAIDSDRGVVGLVSPLLVLVGRLQSVAEHPNIEDFKAFATESIKHYESISFGFGDARGSKLSKYCSFGLCCLIDEVALSTPWGLSSSWKDKNLLDTFHGEEDGSHKFFELLDELEAEPSQNLGALQLFYLFLELGYEGKYRDMPNGGREIHDLRNQLYRTIETTRQQLDPPGLSSSWEGVPGKKNPLLEYVPFWVIMAVTFGVMVIAFAAFSFILSQDADNALRTLAEISAEQFEGEELVIEEYAGDGPVAIEPDLVRNTVDIEELKLLLFLEIDDGILEVIEEPEHFVLRIKDPDLFRSGSHQVQDGHSELIETIGGFLRGSDTHLLVTGHTDDVPVRSLKYPSNWELSRARAEEVKEILAEHSGLDRQIKSQGLADTVNIVPNSNAQNRAINRRVEIKIRK